MKKALFPMIAYFCVAARRRKPGTATKYKYAWAAAWLLCFWPTLGTTLFAQGQPPKDTKPPEAAITAPLSSTKHNEVPEIRGTAIDRDAVNPAVPASGLEKVEVKLCTSKGCWNGSTWISDFAGLPAELSGNNWVLRTRLPEGANLIEGWYSITATAYDREGNRAYASNGFDVTKISIGFPLDANHFYWGIDFADDRRTQVPTAKLAAIMAAQSSAFFASPNVIRFGAVADGATKLLLCVTGRSPGKVSFQRISLQGESLMASDDTFTDIHSTDPATNLAPHLARDGYYYWFALYTVPSHTRMGFVDLGTGEYVSPVVGFKATYAPSYSAAEAPALAVKDPSILRLEPPPVLLVHGLWSEANRWPDDSGVLPSLAGSYENNRITWGMFSYLADFPADNAKSIFADQRLLYDGKGNTGAGVKSILAEYRERFVACSRVDVIGHSMGGLLARVFAQWGSEGMDGRSDRFGEAYRNPENFGLGYMRRLITIGTPHGGISGKLVSVALELPAIPAVVNYFAGVLGYQQLDTEGGGLEDIRQGSSALQQITHTSVPAFAIVGDLADPAESNVLARRLYTICRFLQIRPQGVEISSYDAFRHSLGLDERENHDGWVSTSSQIGGLGSSFYQIFAPVYHTIDRRPRLHGETSLPAIGTKVYSLLTGEKHAFAEGFPAVSTAFPAPASQREPEAQQVAVNQLLAPESTDSLIVIAAPAEGASFAPGANVNLVTQPVSGVTIEALVAMVITKGAAESALLENGVLNTTLTIPADYAGPAKIIVWARDTLGRIAKVERNITVGLLTPPVALTVAPEKINLTGAGEKRQLQVTAQFSAAIKANVTAADTGTRYTSGNAQIVTVSPDGLLQAVGNGETTVQVANGAARQEVAVTVQLSGPHIFTLTPDTLAPGATNVSVALRGHGFREGQQLEFWRNGAPDPAITVQQLMFESEEIAHARLSVTAQTVPGMRTAALVTANNSTTRQTTGGNILLIEMPPNPVPVLTSLSPSIATAGSGSLTLTVKGNSFVSGAIVQWDGTSKVTTFVSASELSASIPASDLTTAGTAQVKVVNPAPGGGTSGALAFTIAVPPNPVPILSSLTPNSANAGSSAIALTVRGSSFVNGAIVQWNGGSRPATFISATELRASIPASDLTSAGNSQVRVFNPSPGGGTSSALTFTISAPANPVPVLSFLTPNSAMAGSGAITLTVRGSSFANGAVIQWNGVSKVTTFISSTEVRGSILASDLAAARSVQVKVFNPAPGGGTSGTLTFTISAPSNPVPVLSSLTPSSANAGSGAFTLTVRGSSFVSGAVVQWNGVSKATTFVSATELQASIPTSDLANPGSAQVKVFNPAPGGGTSVGLMFTINSIPAQDMEREPNESPEQATPVGLGRVMTGKAAFSDSFIYEITFSDGQRERIPDFFKFELAQSAHLELSLKFNAGADLDLFLYSFDGSNWRYYGSSAGVTTSETVITNEPLPPGRYFILVGCYSGSSTYSLSVLPYAKTNLLVNGSFENGPAGLGVTSVPGWTVSRGNVDVIPNSAAVLWAWHQAADGSKSLELTGNPGVGAIRQTFSTEAGRKYLLTGWISHHFAVSTAGAKVSVNGEALEPIRYSVSNTQADMKWARFVRGFVARSASTTIELGDEDISNWIWGGAVLDGLSIETVSVTYQNNFQQNAGLSGLGNTSSAVVAERSILLNRKNPPRPEVRSLSVKERKLVNN